MFLFSCSLIAQEKPLGITVTKDLIEQMDQNKANELIRINIRLVSQYDLQNLNKALTGMERSARRAVVVSELKEFSNKSQKDILTYLETKSNENQAQLIFSLWINNVITCMASNEVIYDLSQRSDIDRIDLDEERNMLMEVEITPGDEPEGGKGVNEITWNVTKVNVPAIWALGYTGTGIKVGVLDTGVNYNHVDLADHMWSDPSYPYHGYDFVNNDNNPMDDHGHGTHCAGTVAGDGTAGSQTGMAPDATIMALKVLSSTGNGTESGVWAAIQFTVEHGGDIISMSLGWQHSWGVDRPSWRNSFNNALAAGVIASVAAGNEGDQQGTYPIPDNVRTPGDCPPPWLNPDQTLTGGISAVVCVGATSSNDNIAYFSSRGPVTWSAINPFNDYAYNPGMGLIRPDVSAPGDNIKSLAHYSNTGYEDGWSGTSMATPCVAGVMALMLNKNPNLTPAEINMALETTAVELGAAGKDNVYGAGRINALAAFNLVSYPGPVYNSHVIDDPNNNGEVEAGESILLSIEMYNGSDSPYSGVVVNIGTDSPYVAFTDASENYGDFASGQYKSITNGFAFDVAVNTPGMETIPVNIEATDGNEIWTSKFDIITYGPSIHLGNITISDPLGNNNGRLDPGETADLIIAAHNTGQVGIADVLVSVSALSGFITFSNTQVNIPVLPPSGSEDVVFNITVDNAAPIGTSVVFHFVMEAGVYGEQKDVLLPIGQKVEDWETGNMSQFEWQTGGNANWAVSTQTPFEGAYCIKSGDINDNQSTWLSLEYNVFSDDSISFWYKVSSEAGWDFLTFYVDNVALGSWAGNVEWSYAAYALSAGTHNLKWTYNKDISVSTGSDCAWVDFIKLPAQPITTAYAGPDTDVCEGDAHQCSGMATLYNSISWTSAGDGTFNNSQVLNPVYTPGLMDITNGSVILTLSVYGPDNTVSDNLTLQIKMPAIADAGEDAPACSEGSFELSTATAVNYVSVAWSTSGDGTFNNASLLNAEYTPGSNDISVGTVTLILTATGSASCGSVTDDIVLNINASPSAFAGSDTETCSNLPLPLTTATAQNYASLVWSTSGDGSFNDNSMLNPVYTAGINDASNGTVTLTLTAIGNSPCADVSSEMIVIINASATAYAGEDAEIKEDESYTLSGAQVQNYSSLHWITSGDGTFDNANILHPTYTPGTNDIIATEVMLTLTATNEICGDVSDQMTLAFNPSGVRENMAGFNVSVSPNPNSGTFTVKIMSEKSELIDIRIYSSVGKLVYEVKNIQVDIEYQQTLQPDLEKGIYLINIKGRELQLNKKVIIE
jgi:subtilisin family serine protease